MMQLCQDLFKNTEESQTHRHSVFRALILLMALGVRALWLARPSTVVADEWKQSMASIKNELATTKNELANLKERKA